ncbi:MAG TPA: AraC family transcriptional regulator [Kofleriaceae bacterium]|nr:AraC family transcriptional regulator [Kofleriaceae bacterium]
MTGCAQAPTGGHGIVTDELRTGRVRVVEVSHPASLRLAAHVHESAKLWLLVEGAVTERTGIDLDSPAPFEVVLRDSLRRHENQYHPGGARSIVVELDPADARVRAVLAAGAFDPAGVCPLVALGARLATCLRAPRSARAREVDAAVGEILAAVARRRRRAPAWLEAARELLVERLAEPPPLAELAATVGVHPVHLAHAFRRRCGTTTRGFVRAHRVFRAVELIAGAVPLARAAAEVGFADQSHMTRALRRDRSITPGRLRPRSPG